MPLILMSRGTIAPPPVTLGSFRASVLAVLWASVGYPWEGDVDRRQANSRRSDEVDLGRPQVEEVAQPRLVFDQPLGLSGTANEGSEALPQSANDVGDVVTMRSVAEQRVVNIAPLHRRAIGQCRSRQQDEQIEGLRRQVNGLSVDNDGALNRTDDQTRAAQPCRHGKTSRIQRKRLGGINCRQDVHDANQGNVGGQRSVA